MNATCVLKITFKQDWQQTFMPKMREILEYAVDRYYLLLEL